MAGVEEAQAASADVVGKWRAPLETTALVLVAAIGFSIVGGIVSAVFRPDTEGWLKLDILGFNVTTLWHVAVLLVAVGLVLALRLPFPPDPRGAAIARLVLLDVVVLGAVIAICSLLGVIGALALSGEDFVVSWPEEIGESMQILAGGVVAAIAGLLALRGRSVLPARVRPAPAPAPAPAPPTAAAGPGSPGWAADPFGRHQWRYWDGTRWTDQVADGSTQSTDPAG